MRILVVSKPRDMAERSHASNVRHEATLHRVMGALPGAVLIPDPEAWQGSMAEADLVVAVGGDGTLLYASHFVGPGTPILGVNSAPESSVGYFCGTSPQHPRFLQHLGKPLGLPATKVTRLQVEVDGTVLTKRGLNDALFCHENPALVTRYRLVPWDKEDHEDQVSSGIWVSTAVGSTAAIRSAGGATSPHASGNLQYKVREPCEPLRSRYQHVHGFLPPGGSLEVTSYVAGGRVHVDGAHLTAPVGLGSTLAIKSSDQPLTLLNFRQKV